MINAYNYLIQSLFFTRQFYCIFVGVIVLFVISYTIPSLLFIAQLLLALFALVVFIDYVLLFFKRRPISVERVLAERFSNADDNDVSLLISNEYAIRLKMTVIDEVPDQFQWRNFSLSSTLEPGERKELKYTLHPTERGEYTFHNINVLLKSPLNLVIRKFVEQASVTVKVYPSFLALQQYSLNGRLGSVLESGSKKVRKLGHSLEFEQIKEYVTGDDIRNINWNATAKRGGQLMVNNYTDERSQQIYCVIDQGRVMKMPFEGMTLLDYAINTSVILSHVALLKQDRAGVITFSNTIDGYLQAGKKKGQMNSILDNLYAQHTTFQETDFEKLHSLLRNRVPQRSLLLLFTNFESFSGMQRQLPYIQSIAKNHLLVVIFFENTELVHLHSSSPTNLEDLYIKTIAEKFVHEKRLIVKELQKYGVMSILTSPKNLSVNAINKYLEIKSRQAI